MMPAEDFRAIPRTSPEFLRARDRLVICGWQFTRFPNAVSNHVLLLQRWIGLEESVETVWLEVQDDDVCAVDLLDDLAMAPNKVAVCARYSCMARILRRCVARFNTGEGRAYSGITAAHTSLADELH